MRAFVPLKLLASSLAVLALPAFAEPTPQQACAYFATFVPIRIQTLGPVYVYRDETQGMVTVGDTKLERYQSLSFESLGKVGIVRSDGVFYQSSFISATTNCIVDIVDRRVITIFVFPGQDTGKIMSLDNGETVNVLGAEPIIVDIGIQGHQGKF